MSFFKVFVIAWCIAMGIGMVFDRIFPAKSLTARGAIYGLIGVSIVLLVLWTLIQMIFDLPQIDEVFPITAIMLGVMFAVGVKGAYQTLKDRHALKREEK